MQMEDYHYDNVTPLAPLGMMERRRSSQRGRHSSGGQKQSSPELSSESSPEASPSRRVDYKYFHRTVSSSSPVLDPMPLSPNNNKPKGKSWIAVLFGSFLGLVVLSSAGMLILTHSAIASGNLYEPTRPDLHFSAAGLRGKMTQGHWEDHPQPKLDAEHHHRKDPATHKEASKLGGYSLQNEKLKPQNTEPKATVTRTEYKTHSLQPPSLPQMHLAPPISKPKQLFESQDPNLYSNARASKHYKRVVALDPSVGLGDQLHHRKIKQFPADFTDNTQLYPILDSEDERLGHMELRAPHSDGECVPMQDWQTTFHPLCNGMHELGVENLGEDNGNDVKLFGTGGFWRYAWRVDIQNAHTKDTIVLKTLK
jgi:hypothetical protein